MSCFHIESFLFAYLKKVDPYHGPLLPNICHYFTQPWAAHEAQVFRYCARSVRFYFSDLALRTWRGRIVRVEAKFEIPVASVEYIDSG